MSKNQNWTWKDYDLLRKKYITAKEEVYATLTDRSSESVDIKATRLEVNHEATLREDEEILLKEYGNTLGSAMLFLLPDRTVYEVKDALLCVED